MLYFVFLLYFDSVVLLHSYHLVICKIEHQFSSHCIRSWDMENTFLPDFEEDGMQIHRRFWLNILENATASQIFLTAFVHLW